MKRQGGSYPARKETLKEAFQAYDESQSAAIACIINGSIHEPGNNKLQQNREEALQFAQGLDPHRLYTNPRDFGRLLGRVSAHLTITNYLKQRRATEVQGLRQGRAGPSPSGQDQPILGPQQRVRTEDSGLVSGMSRRAGPVAVSSLTGPGPVESPAEAHDPKLLKKSLFIPHTTQLLGTFLMAGIASDKDLENHLVRCGTGEGKSVCLGLTATVFALLGFEVSVVCFSSQLSRRDYRAFKELFEDMGVTQKVRYSTIDSCVEWLLENNAIPDVRQATTSFLMDKEVMLHAKSSKLKNSLLLVDEVDVLFSDKFFGLTRNPCITIKSSDSLLKMLFNERNERAKRMQPQEIQEQIKELKQSAECQKILKEYPNLGLLDPSSNQSLLDLKIELALKGIRDFVNGNIPEYRVDRQKRKIGYVSQASGMSFFTPLLFFCWNRFDSATLE